MTWLQKNRHIIDEAKQLLKQENSIRETCEILEQKYKKTSRTIFDLVTIARRENKKE